MKMNVYPLPIILGIKSRNFFFLHLTESIWKWQNERNSLLIKSVSFKEEKRYSKPKVTQKRSDLKVEKKEED